MPIQQPSLEELARIADQYGFNIPPDRLATFGGLIGHTLGSYARLDELVEPSLPVKYPRQPGFRPPPEDNPLGAWYWKTDIRGGDSGPLAGKTVAIKDNVCVAGVPMMNGTAVLEGYVPDVDAAHNLALAVKFALNAKLQFPRQLHVIKHIEKGFIRRQAHRRYGVTRQCV